MKKVLTMIAMVAVAGSAMADLTEFSWVGGEAGSAVAGNQVTTFVGSDFAPLMGGDIQLIDLAGFASQLAANITPFGPSAGKWGTVVIGGDASRVGMSALAIVDDDGIFTVGEQVNVFTVSAPIIELEGGGPTLLPQEFAPGAFTTVTVIPEPATFGLMGIAGLGMFLARKKARR